tara:strand:- start:22158 stop:23180 length:1023 start_codon:yes stop_codon:yes gene_type:complete
MNYSKVTFGVVNCNRLYYLRSTLESLKICTLDYPNLEFIVVDNASVEEGTAEYLDKIEKEGVRVFRQEDRDPSNEFARALNLICKEATGDFICPLQGDMQFTIADRWLEKYVNFYNSHKDEIGYIIFDAQRKITHGSHSFSNTLGEDYKFVFDYSRPKINGGGNVMLSREVIDLIYPWSITNISHEGGGDSETAMLKKVHQLIDDKNLKYKSVLPIIPPSITIYTDERGTNARVRGEYRYGDYWPPKDDSLHSYYEISDYETLIKKFGERKIPVGIEEIAITVGWDPYIDDYGNWKKNPIKPETAKPNEFVKLTQTKDSESEFINYQDSDSEYLSEWLDD